MVLLIGSCSGVRYLGSKLQTSDNLFSKFSPKCRPDALCDLMWSNFFSLLESPSHSVYLGTRCLASLLPTSSLPLLITSMGHRSLLTNQWNQSPLLLTTKVCIASQPHQCHTLVFRRNCVLQRDSHFEIWLKWIQINPFMLLTYVKLLCNILLT